MINLSYLSSRRNVKETWDFINRLTPADVLEYFQASPVLSQYADDLARAPLFAPETRHNAPEIDFQAQRDAKAIEREFGPGEAPSLADVAELLTGKRHYGGGVYYRLKKALAAYETLTSYPEEEANPPKTPQSAKLAA
jgi:hypothetical protein